MSYSHLIIVIYLVYICYIPLIFLLYSCHMSVISLQYSRLPMTLCRCACAGQGLDGAPSLDVMLLKQQVFTADGSNQGNVGVLQYAYRRKLNQEPRPFAVSSIQAGRVDSQELG